MLTVELLEGRFAPAVLIQTDYSRDTGFFANPAARAVVDQLARELGDEVKVDWWANFPKEEAA